MKLLDVLNLWPPFDRHHEVGSMHISQQDAFVPGSVAQDVFVLGHVDQDSVPLGATVQDAN